MLSKLLMVVIICTIIWLGATFVGRAADHEVKQYDLIYKLDKPVMCERVLVKGNLYHENCSYVIP